MRKFVVALALLLAAQTAMAQQWARESVEKSPRHREWVQVKYGNRVVDAFVAYPERKDNAPVVVVIHTINGFIDWIESAADQLAAEGYIAIARRFPMPDEQRADMCLKALDLAKQPAEQKLVIEVLKIQPSTETLKVAIKLMKTPELKEEATQATLIVAQKLGAKGIDVKELLSKIGRAHV